MIRAMLLMLCCMSACSRPDWELQNSNLYHLGALNEAELGMANLKQAMLDPSLLADVARGLRSRESQAALIKMLAKPSFQEEMKNLIAENGEVAEFLTPGFYAKKEDNGPPDALASLLLALNPRSPRAASMRTNARMDALSDLKELARAQNPVVGYWDPLNLVEGNFWGNQKDGAIGWLRHAEMKHGRVAMAGFVGYCLHENGIRWPFPLSYSLPDYSSFEGLSAPAVWDAIPTAAKLQILGVIGFFEIWSEYTVALNEDGQTGHYMRGGKPGYFPTFKALNTLKIGFFGNIRVPLPAPPNLFDPFGLQKKFSEETKAKKLNIEINNGRLAMLGLMSLISEAKIPGAVPALTGLIKQYDGQPMAPFSDLDVDLPFVTDMLDYKLPF
jgi:hypothetical protein